MYSDKIQLKLYRYVNNAFTLLAVIDDYQEISFTRSKYEAGDFTVTINYNIPNAHLFARGLFVQFGSDEYDVGEILTITDSLGSDGKGSQTRTIKGKDLRYLLKRRIILNLNSGDTWEMTDKAETVMRNMIAAQCGSNVEEKRRLPIVNDMTGEAIGSTYTVSESYTNLYEALVTVATQASIGWRIKFKEGMTLEFFESEDLSDTVFFSPGFDSIANGSFSDSSESFANTVYIGGKGEGEEKEIYEGESSLTDEKILVEGHKSFLVDENGNFIVVDFVVPNALDRYEAWSDNSDLTSEDEYRTKANNILNQYMQTLTVNGQTLAKSPYIYKENYDVGSIVTVELSGKSANVEILSVTEHWNGRGNYAIQFTFGKPLNTLDRQLQILLSRIQQTKKSATITSVKWYETPTDTEQTKAEVTCDTLGFTGSGGTFILYLDRNGVGSKNYNIYCKNLTGSVTLTAGGSNLTLSAGNKVTRIYVDTDGNILQYT